MSAKLCYSNRVSGQVLKSQKLEYIMRDMGNEFKQLFSSREWCVLSLREWDQVLLLVYR